jgi:hypothetical protein
MKPSERIKEIYNSKTRIFTGDNDIKIQTEDWIESILNYLDETHQQNKIKEYEEHNRLIRSVQV